MRTDIDDQKLQRSAAVLHGAAVDIRDVQESAGTLLVSAGRHAEDDLVRTRLGSAHRLIEALATDHDARSALASALESFHWTTALLSGRLLDRHTDGQPLAPGGRRASHRSTRSAPTITGEPVPPFPPPDVYTSDIYDPYEHLTSGTMVVTAVGGANACATDHTGSGGLLGPDGRAYPLAYPEFADGDGAVAHIGPRGQQVGGTWRTVAIATGVSTTSVDHPILSFLAGAVTMRPPTAMPINPNDYSLLHIDRHGVAWIPARPAVPGYSPADIPEPLEMERPSGAGEDRTPPLSATAMDASMLVIGSVAAGLATTDYERNRATRAYVVLFEEARDGRLRSQFIEHQVWVLDDSRMEVRTAGLSVAASGITRMGLTTAPPDSGADAITIAVPDPNQPSPRA